MVRNNAPRGGRPVRRFELDLSDVFDVEQKFQFIRLVNDIIEDMQKQTRDNFEKLELGRLPDDQGINPPNSQCRIIPNHNDENDRHVFEHPGPSFNFVQRSKWTYPKNANELQTVLGKSDLDVILEGVAEQKKDALAHINKWRLSTQKRFNDIVVKNGANSGNTGGHRNGFGNQGGHGYGGRVFNLPPANPADIEDMLHKAYPAIDTPLKHLSKEKRMLIMHCTLLIFLGLDQYALYSRILLVRLASSLDIPLPIVLDDEKRVACALSKIIQGIPVEEIVQRRAEEAKTSRRWKPGMAMAAISGNPGTLSAPLAAAGIGTVFNKLSINQSATAGLLGPMNESTVVVGTLFGLYGARQGSKTIEAHRKDVLDFGMVSIHGANTPELIDPKDVPTGDRRMRVTIGIGGMLTGDDSFIDPWKALGSKNEAYVLRYELEALKKAGDSFIAAQQTLPGYESRKEMSSMNIFDRLRKSLWPVGIVKISKVIDNTWCVGMVRAEKAGNVLADILMNRLYGERPITLIGYGFGARAVYACLMCLAEKRAFGLVENVIMMGAPCPTEVRTCSTLKSVVAGRFINVYSKKDHMLGFLYRTCHWKMGIAGLQPIQGVPNIQNLDMSEIVTNHFQWAYLVGYVLSRVGWEDVETSLIPQRQAKLIDLIETLKKHDEEQAIEVGHVRVIADVPAPSPAATATPAGTNAGKGKGAGASGGGGGGGGGGGKRRGRKKNNKK
ncbi:DUF726-domain-containing protein [Annulohypoxylon moriforme]|nr:DUF726-domain-containing protein [Annulohypoxylon moriforme]